MSKKYCLMSNYSFIFMPMLALNGTNLVSFHIYTTTAREVKKIPTNIVEN